MTNEYQFILTEDEVGTLLQALDTRSEILELMVSEFQTPGIMEELEKTRTLFDKLEDM